MSALISNPTVRSILRGVLVWAPFWIGTTVGFGALGLLYVLFVKQDTYLSSQALLVRDEATGAVMRLGRFQSQAEMKAAQETILEMAKSHQVVHDALIALGPESSLVSWLSWGDFPSKELVDEVAKSSISVHAPKGTEFGVTEVIYLDVKASRQDKALALNKALCDSLEASLQKVRKARADGVIAELTNARDSAKRELGASTARLHEMERSAGSDLSDLRGMTDTIAGAATSRAEFDQIKNEIRQAEVNRQSLLADREMLIKASQDPNSFLVAPGTVLNSHPGLKRLREGLVDAQLSGSQLTGRFTQAHPLVNASNSAQSSIIKRFLRELKASIASVDSDIDLATKKIQSLEAQRTAAEERLTRLADSRALYANLLSEVKSKVSILESTERELAEAQAARDSSISTSLLTRLDAPIVGDRPIGPGRTTIIGMCTFAGLVFGLGIVFILTPIDAGPNFGRRALDQVRGRRQSDRAPNPNATNTTDSNPASSKSLSKLNLPTSVGATGELGDVEDAYQPLIRPRPAASAIKEEPAKEAAKDDVSDVDRAFEELAKLQSRKPESRTEELSLQMKVHELKSFLSSHGIKPIDIEIAKRGDDTPRQKPRPSRP